MATQITFSEMVKTEVCALEFSEACFFAVLRALIDDQDPNHGPVVTLTTQVVKIFKFLRKNFNTFYPALPTKIYYGTRTAAARRKYLMTFPFTPELAQKLRRCHFRRYDCCRAYMAGLFLSCGSVNDPRGKYNHLELRLKTEAMVATATHLLQKFQITPLRIAYRDYEVLYLKRGDQISDFLKLINATEQFYDFENLKIARDFGVNMQRLTNLEVSNVHRTIVANEKMLNLFEQVQHYQQLRDKLTPRDRLYFAIIAQDPSQSLTAVAEEMTRQIGHRVSKNILHHTRQKVINLLKTVANAGEG